MPIKVVTWIAGAALIPVLAWGVHTSWTLRSIGNETSRILSTTSHQTTVIEDNTRAMESLTHYIRWLSKELTGNDPPPPIQD